MKRSIFAIAIAGVLLTAAAIPAAADYVYGLDPYGDNFLSLRTGPGGQYPEIDRMGPNTYLEVIGSSGPWLHVRLNNGLAGWAYSRYIRRGYPN